MSVDITFIFVLIGVVWLSNIYFFLKFYCVFYYILLCTADLRAANILLAGCVWHIVASCSE